MSASAYKLNSYPYPSSYDNPTRRANDNENNTYSYPSPASVNTPSTATKDGLPIFGKTSKTLFPQQHGSSLSPAATGSNGNELTQAGGGSTSAANAHPAGSGTASMLGTKRKLEPLSEAEFGDGIGGADYFTPEAPVVGSTVQPSGPVSTSSSSNLTAKRRASQTFINTANISRGEQQGQLPTPASLNSAGSASASSSERRSSNDSSEAGLPSANMTSTITARIGGPGYIASALPMSIQEEDAQQATSRYANITPRQHDHMAHPRAVEADTKAGYSFPMSKPPVGGEVNADTRLSASTQMPGVSGPASTSAAYYESQPSYSDRGYSPLPPSSSATLHHIPPYASPASAIQNRIPPQGSALPPDLRSKATTIFGGTGGVRPSYTSNGVPVGVSSGTNGKIDNLKLPPHGGGGQLHHPGQPMYNGPSTSTKAGFAPGPSALSAHQQQQLANSSLPYARSPALKVSHKIAERKRRKEMKELFDELRDCIPAMNASATGSTTPTVIDGIPISTPAPPQSHPADVGGRGIKSSKWEVLAKAVEYINKLHYENSELNNAVLELQRLNQAFQDELSLVKNGGTSNGQLGDSGFASAGNGLNGDGSMSYHQESQLYPHQQPHPQATSASYNGQQQGSTHPSPSPVSVHSMPPLTHHSHSMPAAIGGGTHSNLHSPHPSMHNSPLAAPSSATPVVYPISAPPHMASHSFFSPNDSNNLGGNNTAQAFANPNQRHFALHNHSRNVSMGSNNGSVNGGNAAGQGHFEHAGSAPPALQHHPHQQHQPHHLQQQHNGMASNHGSPIVHPQSAVQIFSHHPSPSYGSDVQLPHQNGYATHQHPQQLQRPGSMRSHHSNQSILSGMSAGGHSHPSQSPGPQHIQVQQQQQQEAWGSSSPYSQQAPLVRTGTQPPGSAQGTPMISPLNATY